MHLGMLLDMAAEGMPDRLAVGSRSDGITYAELAVRARRVAALLAASPGERVGLVDLNSEAVALGLFGSALAGKPFVPVNYRLTDDKLAAVVSRMAPATVIVGEGMAERIAGIEGITCVSREDLLAASASVDGDQLAEAADPDPDGIAVLLFTSGTTGEPKAAVLRHRNLTSYIITSVEFAGAQDDEAALVSVPPYHIAGISAVLSSTYIGRRMVYLEAFEPGRWVRHVRAERITHAMVVPTMLGRVLDLVEGDGLGLPSLRSLSYGGGPMPAQTVERALRVLPDVGLVNAYGLTETSSTIAVLGPEDHREAFASDDPAVRARLGSVGRPLPSLEVGVRDPLGNEVPAGVRGEIWVRGEQVSGEYLGRSLLNEEGWFTTRDAGEMDEAGYLYVHGRLDDVIVRGGENLSPGEIEAVLTDHPAVEDAAVVGVPDPDWGEKVVAAVVLRDGALAPEAELREFVRERLRSTRTPEHIQLRSELPYSETGKLLRRALRDELSTAFDGPVPA